MSTYEELRMIVSTALLIVAILNFTHRIFIYSRALAGQNERKPVKQYLRA